MSKRLGLLYLGRLEEEKGFWILLEWIRSQDLKNLEVDFYIFWAGKYEETLLELTRECPQIHFFGWKPLTEIERYLSNIDYCLMPSLCLETFGLSALNILSYWISVIGYKQGGLTPFIDKEYDLSQYQWKQPVEQLDLMIKKLSKEKKEQNSDFYSLLSQKNKQLAEKYDKEARFQRFQELTFDFKCRKILMVSDFINPIWGIETGLHEMKKLLESHGYEVILFWTSCPRWAAGKLKKYRGIALSIFNLWSWWGLTSVIKKEKPDLIWYHSLIRWQGRFPVFQGIKSSAQQRVMYHDLWVFHPFPSQVYKESDIHKLSLKNFLREAKTQNPLKLLLVTGKYLSLKLLISQLKNQKIKHLVPSRFMVPIVERSFQIPAQNIQVFEHFVQR